MIKYIVLVLIIVLIGVSYSKGQTMQESNYNKLTAQESAIINDKATEAPFSGKYNKFYKDGVYRCKKCDAPLFNSESKFDSRSGWPSFDDEIKGAINKIVDADGRRTEITCAKCGAHLGHAFYGEKFTAKNTRHCVNSLSLKFEAGLANITTEVAYFAGGCFWGVEYLFEKQDGVIDAVSGYMGGSKDKPTYKDVSTGTSGHVEVVQIRYNPKKITYEKLAKLFFEIHDPTQSNGQGPDLGSQYLSVVFCKTEQEKKIVQGLIKLLTKKGYNIATKVKDAKVFFKAEDYHQDYYQRKGSTPYCHRYVKRF